MAGHCPVQVIWGKPCLTLSVLRDVPQKEAALGSVETQHTPCHYLEASRRSDDDMRPGSKGFQLCLHVEPSNDDRVLHKPSSLMRLVLQRLLLMDNPSL